ncbi:MAG: hypothetical protein K2O69_08095, partial [Odoribacter sp.]|nr:hypothetical protein [Odoribacter sp.]
MKRLFLSIVFVLGTMSFMSAQIFEHFDVEITQNGVSILRPKFDCRPTSGVNGMAGDYEKTVYKMMKELVLTFPEEIKAALKQQDVWADLRFNAKGEIFYLTFLMSKNSNVNCLTDEQWLEVYHAIRKQRLDISKFELLDDFEWGAAGP